MNYYHFKNEFCLYDVVPGVPETLIFRFDNSLIQFATRKEL